MGYQIFFLSLSVYLVSREGRPLHGEESKWSQPVVDAGQDHVEVTEEGGVEVLLAAATVQTSSVDVELWGGGKEKELAVLHLRIDQTTSGVGQCPPKELKKTLFIPPLITHYFPLIKHVISPEHLEDFCASRDYKLIS